MPASFIRHNPAPARCAYCEKPTTQVWRYRSQLSARRKQITVYLATCDDHAGAVQTFAHRNPVKVR